jgi:hypothetical protein
LSLGRDEEGKGWRRGRGRKGDGKAANSFLSVVRFNFPRFASEPLNALQPALLPIHFLAPFPPRFRGDQRVTMPFSYPRRDRARIDTFDISSDSNARCARVTEGKCQRHAFVGRKAANSANLANTHSSPKALRMDTEIRYRPLPFTEGCSCGMMA